MFSNLLTGEEAGSDDSAGGGLFAAAAPSGGGLFGGGTTVSESEGSGLFGDKGGQPAVASPFAADSSPAAAAPGPAATSSPSLFGDAAEPAAGPFDAVAAPSERPEETLAPANDAVAALLENDARETLFGDSGESEGLFT